MKSAFGVEHGQISKRRLAAAERLSDLGGAFGSMPKRGVAGHGRDSALLPLAAIYGGAAAGGATGYQLHRKENKANALILRSNRGKQAANTRVKRQRVNELAQSALSKGLPVHVPTPKNKSAGHYLITDVGTRAQKLAGEPRAPRRRMLSKETKALTAGMGGLTFATTGGLTAYGQHKARPQLKQDVARSELKLARQRQELRDLGVKGR